MVIYAGSYHLSTTMDGENRIILNVGGVRYVSEVAGTTLIHSHFLFALSLESNIFPCSIWMFVRLAFMRFMLYYETWIIRIIYECLNVISVCGVCVSFLQNLWHPGNKHTHSSRLFEKIVFNFKRTLNIARREWTAFLQNFPRRTETWENLSKLVISLQQLERMGWLCSEWLFGWVRLSNEWFLFVGKSVEKQIKRKWFLGENFAGAKWLLFGLGSWICWTGNPGQTAEKRVKLHIHTKSAHENMRTKTRRRARAREKERDKVRWRQSSGTGIEWGKHITDEHKAKSRKHHTNIYLN